jgi:uncharacterized RDD family membrane protein YckC
MNSSGLVSKEHISPFKKRVGAFVIDDLAVSLLVLTIFWSQIAQLETVEQVNLFLQTNFLVIAAIKVLYHTMLVWQSGMTLGKYLMKIKVVFLDSGLRPSFSIALVRASLRIVSEMIFYIGFIMALWNPMVQTLHDKFSRCIVVDA